MHRDRKRILQRGSAIIEFALVGSFIFLPLLAGLTTVGLALVAAQQVSNLNSTAGQMFAAGVDFSSTGTGMAIVGRASGSLDITNATGNGEIILTEVDVSTDGNNTVTAQPSIIIGNPAQGTSKYIPAPPTVPAAFTAGLLNNLSLSAGQKFYLAETYYNNPLYTWAFAPTSGTTVIYMKAVF